MIIKLRCSQRACRKLVPLLTSNTPLTTSYAQEESVPLRGRLVMYILTSTMFEVEMGLVLLGLMK